MGRRRGRRAFLHAVSAGLGVGVVRRLSADDGPPPVHPRATDGDRRSEPKWEEQVTVTVGVDRGDLVGRDDKVLQAAIDSIAGKGGGTVRILPGTFTLRNAVFVRSGIRLVGSGPESVITKRESVRVDLADDADWFDQEISLAEAAGLQVGDGVVLQAKHPDHGGRIVIKRTLVARSGNRFKVDRGLRDNLWLVGKPTCATLFPLLAGERVADVTIENLTLDGNGGNNENFNGNHGGCIFLQDCTGFTIRGVTARNYNGDGISFQVCHDVVVENCHCHDNTDLGLHPGSGSQRPRIIDNRLDRNDQGLFWCWGVRHGLAERNRLEGNRSYGMSIGHRDTDNVIRDNEITNSGKVGLLFRDESRGNDFWANRNRVENNRILDSGGDDGIGIDVRGRTRDVVLVGNSIRESRGPANRIGIRIGERVGALQMADNRIDGYAKPIADGRGAAAPGGVR